MRNTSQSEIKIESTGWNCTKTKPSYRIKVRGSMHQANPPKWSIRREMLNIIEKEKSQFMLESPAGMNWTGLPCPNVNSCPELTSSLHWQHIQSQTICKSPRMIIDAGNQFTRMIILEAMMVHLQTKLRHNIPIINEKDLIHHYHLLILLQYWRWEREAGLIFIIPH